MDSKEHVAAGNALIEWFNSQEIAPYDAERIMVKVLAKLLVTESGLDGPTPPHSAQKLLDHAIDSFTLDLVHAINDRLFHVRRK